ncbi:MAG: beta-N-acetylhexosaminidase [Alphaproteobacteria bacterium]
MVHKALIVGCSGPELIADERAFLRDVRPCGLILFARNCQTRDQIARLTDDVRECVLNDHLLILVDQEGGRVQRMGPPEWRKYPPAQVFAHLYRKDPQEALDAARGVTRLMAGDLYEVGINVDCAPVLDVPAPGAHDIIGDRAYGDDPETIIALARVVADTFLEGGVLPVIKHIPGHGRARADSHKALPVIDASLEELAGSDFRPFMALNDLPLAMTAHVVLKALDEDAPASVSALIMDQVIRKQIGFKGLVMSDDLDMAALKGTLPERAKGVISAGCDVVLHCSGKLRDAEQVAEAVPVLEGRALARYEAALARLNEPVPFDEKRALGMLEKLQA